MDLKVLESLDLYMCMLIKRVNLRLNVIYLPRQLFGPKIIVVKVGARVANRSERETERFSLKFSTL